MEIRYKFNARILILAAVGAIMVCSSYLIYVYNPLQLIIKKILTMAPGSILFNLWSAPPYDVIMKVYLFNVTNAEKFFNGEEKMQVSEVGPYVYREILTNNNATFNDDGTMTFQPNREIQTDRERSIGDPSKDWIISPNIPLLGIQAMLNDKPMVTSMVFSGFVKAMGSEPFKNLTIDQYLWGYDDEIIRVANQFIPSWIDFDTFGILHRLLAVDNSNTVTIALDPKKNKSNNELLTEEEKEQMYHVVRWNDSPGLPQWGYLDGVENETIAGNKKCQLVEGAFEGTLFPPHMKPNTDFKMFRGAFCRPVPLVFENETTSKDGFQAYKYKVADNFLATPEEFPENKCYCYQDKCLRKGLGTIAPCYYEIPITISHPHFYKGDPSLLEQQEGLKPNETLHNSFALIHPELGIPIDGNLKIQINLDIGETKFNSKTRPFNNMVVPLFWIELTMGDLPSFVKFLINLSCHFGPAAQVVSIYLLGILGIAFISGTALFILFFSNTSVTPTISLRGEYSPIPIISIPVQYFKPDIRISK